MAFSRSSEILTPTTIPDNSVTNAKVDSAAAIAFSKLAALTSGNILVGNASNQAASVALSGDATISNTGVLTIAAGAVVTADLADSAVTTAKIADSNVTTAKIAANAVDSTKVNTSSVAVLGTAQEYTRAHNFNATTLTDAANISWDLSQNQVAAVTLGGNRTLSNPTNQVDGAVYILEVKQDATGNRTLSFDTAYKWPGGTAPVVTPTANKISILTFISDGTSMYGVSSLNY